ncbi:hypothetical protein BH09BAC1_BH09BAC1_26110 [soil metagenome]
MKHRIKLLILTLMCSLMVSPSLMAQDKNVTKAEEYVKKGLETSNQTEKREHYEKAVEYYTKAGMGKELFELIGDAQVAGKDYVSAAKYYTRGTTDGKKAGYGKIGDAMVEDADASSDPKEIAKLIKSALSHYNKSADPKAGYKAVGDLYYKQGPTKYNEALTYYIQGGAGDMVKKIAEEYKAQGNDTLAAQTYERMDNADGYNAAAKIYDESGDHSRAYIAYEKAGNMDGLLQYANREFEIGNTEAGVPQYRKIADIYEKKGDKAGMAKLAESASKYGQYQLANELYMKINDFKKAEMALVYDDLVNFNFDGAIDHATKAEDLTLVAAIKSSRTAMEAISKVAKDFDLIRQNEPSVTKQYDKNGSLQLSAEDMQSLKGYYTAYKSKIADQTYLLAANYAKLNHEVLKQVVKTKFKAYGAVRNILDTNMMKKKEKAAVKTEDTFL